MTPIDYIRVDADIAMRQDLSSTEKLFLGLVKNFNHKGLMMNNDSIGQLIGVKSDTITSIIRSLRNKGLVEIKNGQSKYRKIFYSGKKSEVETTKSNSTPENNRATPDFNRVYSGEFSEHNISNTRKRREAPPFSDFQTLWDSKDNLPQIKSFTSQRQKHFRARMQEPLFAENWRGIIDRLSGSSFCTGSNNRGWKADIDWLLKNETNYAKVLEGRYANKSSGGDKNSSGVAADDCGIIQTQDCDPLEAEKLRVAMLAKCGS